MPHGPHESTGPSPSPSPSPTGPGSFDPAEYPPHPESLTPASTTLWERTTPPHTGRRYDWLPAFMWASFAWEEAYDRVMADPAIPWQIWDRGLKAAMVAVAQAARQMGDEHADHMVAVRYDPQSMMALVQLECECGQTRIMPI